MLKKALISLSGLLAVASSQNVPVTNITANNVPVNQLTPVAGANNLQGAPSAGPSSFRGGNRQDGRLVVGYYQNYKGVDIKDVDGDKLTHFIYTFLKLSNDSFNVEDGDKFLDTEKLFPGDDQNCQCCAKGNYYQVYKLREKYPHLRTIMSIGGWEHSRWFSKALETQEGRAKFVTQTTKVMLEYGFDGIDIDWYVASRIFVAPSAHIVFLFSCYREFPIEGM
jgi:chitinase